MKEEKPSVEPLLEAAADHLQQNDVSRALFCYENAFDSGSTDLRLLKGMANCYFILGDFDRAARFWDCAQELDPYDQEIQQKQAMYHSPSFQSWMKRIREAVKNVEMKEYDKARDQLKHLLEEKEGVVSLYQILGLSHMACSDPVSARRVWERGLRYDISNAMLLKYLQSLDKVQEFKQARSGTIKNRKIRIPWIKVGTGAAALLTCMAVFTAAQQENPKKTEYSAELRETPATQAAALLLNDREIYESPVSEPHPDAAFGEDGSSAESSEEMELQEYKTGFRAYLKGDWEGARNGFYSVVYKESGTYINRESLYYLARICYLTNRYDEAERYFQQYLKQFPESNYYDESLYYLGCLYHRTKYDDKAREAFNELYRLAPASGYLTSSDCRAAGFNKELSAQTI